MLAPFRPDRASLIDFMAHFEKFASISDEQSARIKDAVKRELDLTAPFDSREIVLRMMESDRTFTLTVIDAKTAIAFATITIDRSLTLPVRPSVDERAMRMIERQISLGR